MKLLRDTFLLRAVSRLLAGRRNAARSSYTVTVPAPLERACASNVIELHRRAAATGTRSTSQAEPLPSSVHLALVSSR
jgi:hypothetical protein